MWSECQIRSSAVVVAIRCDGALKAGWEPCVPLFLALDCLFVYCSHLRCASERQSAYVCKQRVFWPIEGAGAWEIGSQQSMLVHMPSGDVAVNERIAVCHALNSGKPVIACSAVSVLSFLLAGMTHVPRLNRRLVFWDSLNKARSGTQCHGPSMDCHGLFASAILKHTM